MNILRLAGLLPVGALLGKAQTDPASAPVAPPKQETMIVTGTWEPLALEESDRSVNQYPLQNASVLFGSLADALSLDSSVAVQSRGANGVQADFSIRGGSFEQTLVLLNGVRLSDDQSAHYNSDLPI